MLYVSHLDKSFEGRKAVDDVSFSVASNERVALLGPNGAGKSTTLMMILGVTTPDSGEVTIDGISVRRDRARALGRIGFAAAYMTPPHSLKVRESLRVAAATAGLPLRSDQVDEMVERFEIGTYMNRLGGELSSGQKTLVGLARAVIAKPPLVVLDEPTAYLDPSVSLEVRRKIETACDDWGSALLITSHNMRDIDHLCSRVIFLRRGRVIYDLTPADLRLAVGTDDLDAAFIDIAAVENAASDTKGNGK